MRKLLSRYSALSVEVKAVLWLTVSNVILRGISFFTAPLFSHLLSEEEYGKLTLYLSFEQIMIILATWELGLGPYQKGVFKFKNQLKSFTTHSILLSNLITVVFFALVLVFRGAFERFTGIDGRMTFILFLFMIVQIAYQCWMTRMRIEFNYRNASILMIALGLAQALAPLWAVKHIAATANVKLEYTLLPAILLGAALYIKSFRPSGIIGHFSLTKEHFSFLVPFTLPLILHSLSYYVLSQSDRVMIGKLVGNVPAGIYGVAYTVASVIMLLQTSLAQVLSPWMYKQLEAGKYDALAGVTDGVVLLMAVLYTLFIIVSPEVILLLYRSSYHEGIFCIPPIVAGIFFMLLYSLFVNVETYFEKTKYVAIVSTVCAVINIVLNYFGIQLFGYVACAYTTLFCYILFAAGHYMLMKRTLKKNSITELSFHGKRILAVSIGVMAFSLAVLPIYGSRLARIGVTAVLLASLVWQRKRIIGLIRTIRA